MGRVMADLRDMAKAWLERNAPGTPPMQQGVPPPKVHGTPQTQGGHKKGVGVPPFHPLGVERWNTSPQAERSAEHIAERWRDLFEERAAIREHDGGLSRTYAEAGALADLARRWRSENPLSASDSTACAHCGKRGPDTPVLARGGHAWLHKACWGPMDAARQREALDTVQALLRAAP